MDYRVFLPHLGKWMAIKRLVKNENGSTLYWYIESWDKLRRFRKSAIMTFF
jgi:hypothetical protein